MAKLLVKLLIIFCFGFMLPEATQGLRIKRADDQASATGSLMQANPAKGNATELPMTQMGQALTANIVVIEKPQAEPKFTEASEAALSDDTAANENEVPVEEDGKVDLMEDAEPIQRLKRREDAIEPPRPIAARGLNHNAAVPPYVYFNKMISPDGNQELKEFQFLAPNMVFQSVQHEMNYEPGGPDLGGVLVLNAENNLNNRLGMGKQTGANKRHHKSSHKSSSSSSSSSSLGMPPFLYMLQQMLQPNLNAIDLDVPRNNRLEPQSLYQFLDGAVDNIIHNNRDVIERLIEREREGTEDKDDIENFEKPEKFKETNDIISTRKDDELMVSCPIHHEHHTNNNGDIMDDDVVLVNECHIV